MPRDEVDLLLADRVDLDQSIGELLLGDDVESGMGLLLTLAAGEDDGGLPFLELVLRRQVRALSRILENVVELIGRFSAVTLEELLQAFIRRVASLNEADRFHLLLQAVQGGKRLRRKGVDLLAGEVPRLVFS